VSVLAQSPLKFEVTTIKPAPADAVVNRVVQADPGRISFQMILRNLIYYAYGNGLSTALQVSGGPDWIHRTRYDIQGLAQASATQRQFRAMLRALLEERFGLKIHTETHSIDVYALVAVRNDGKLGPRIEDWTGTCQSGAPPTEDDPKTPRCTGYLSPAGIMSGRCNDVCGCRDLVRPTPSLRPHLRGSHRTDGSIQNGT